jgi:cell division protein FtsB
MQEEYTSVTDVSALDVDDEQASVKAALGTPFVRVILRLIPVLLLVTSITMFITGMIKFDELERERAELEERIEGVEYEIDELEYLIDMPLDDEYKIRIAREKLGMCFPDEIIYHTNLD